MTNDNTPAAGPSGPSEADLDAMLADLDKELAATLERIKELPQDSQEFAKMYADALHRVQRTLAMWQFEHGLTDRTKYRQILLALSSDLTLSGLRAEARTMGKAQRTSIYFHHMQQLFKRAVKVGAVVAPSPANQARVLDRHGQPIRRKN